MSASRKPKPKVVAGATAAAGATVIVWALSLFGVDAPAGVEGAFATLLAAAAGYLTPDSKQQ